jgi:membrane associated rhomboid family serine protease
VTLSVIAIHVAVFAAGAGADRSSWTGAALSLFVHGGLLHLAGNMTALWLFGENVEDRLGHDRFLALYLGAGCAGRAAGLWAGTGAVPILGAGGAVAGVIGAYLITFPRSRLLVAVPTSVPLGLIEAPAVPFAAGWYVWQAVAGFGAWPGAALPTLLVGTTVGIVGAVLLRRPERRQVDWWAP